MPTYIILWNWTDEGIRNVKKSPAELALFRKTVEKCGGKVEAFDYTMGEYDGVARVNVATDEAWMKIAYTLGASGSMRTRTLKALSETEATKIINQL